MLVGDPIDLIVAIALEVSKAIHKVENTTCGLTAELFEKTRKPQTIGVKCNIIKGHLTNHTNGLMEWSNSDGQS